MRNKTFKICLLLFSIFECSIWNLLIVSCDNVKFFKIAIWDLHFSFTHTYTHKSLNGFWLAIKTEFPAVSKMALNILLLFYATNWVQSGDLSIDETKSKYQSTLESTEDTPHPDPSSTQPRFRSLWGTNPHIISWVFTFVLIFNKQ